MTEGVHNRERVARKGAWRGINKGGRSGVKMRATQSKRWGIGSMEEGAITAKSAVFREKMDNEVQRGR